MTITCAKIAGRWKRRLESLESRFKWRFKWGWSESSDRAAVTAENGMQSETIAEKSLLEPSSESTKLASRWKWRWYDRVVATRNHCALSGLCPDCVLRTCEHAGRPSAHHLGQVVALLEKKGTVLQQESLPFLDVRLSHPVGLLPDVVEHVPPAATNRRTLSRLRWGLPETPQQDPTRRSSSGGRSGKTRRRSRSSRSSRRSRRSRSSRRIRRTRSRWWFITASSRSPAGGTPALETLAPPVGQAPSSTAPMSSFGPDSAPPSSRFSDCRGALFCDGMAAATWRKLKTRGARGQP